jgi:hypothetical protein
LIVGDEQEGLDDLARALSVVEKHKEVAAMAAAEATMSSRKASNILNEMLGSFSIEMANAHSNSLQLQVGFHMIMFLRLKVFHLLIY